MTKKTVFITGASKGVGKSAAELFLKDGWNVAATMRDPSKTTLPGCFCLALDVTQPERIKQAVETAIAKFGSIDVLVNNAGYGAVGPFELATADQVRRQFETNVFGSMAVIKALLPHFRSAGQGIIINVTSIAGRTTFPLYSLYNSSKWAVEGFSESLRFELEPFNIKIKMVEPAAIKTDFFGGSADILKDQSIKAYDRYYAKVLTWIERSSRTGMPPEKVAREIVRAATDNQNRFRYPVGGDGKLFLFLKRILPDNWLFGLSKMIFVR